MTLSTSMSRVAVLVTAGLGSIAQAEVIFDSFRTINPSGAFFSHDRGETNSHIEIGGGFENLTEVGHRLNLTGSVRQLTQLEAKLVSFAGANVHPQSYDQVFRIYSVDAGGLPADLLWTGRAQGVSFPSGPLSFRTAEVTLSLNLIVPDSIFLTTAEENIVFGTGGESTVFGIGWQAQSSPSVGGVGPIHGRDTTTGVWGSLATPSLQPETFELRLTAIPGPGAFGTLAVGVAVISGRRRRSPSPRP